MTDKIKTVIKEKFNNYLYTHNITATKEVVDTFDKCMSYLDGKQEIDNEALNKYKEDYLNLITLVYKNVMNNTNVIGTTYSEEHNCYLANYCNKTNIYNALDTILKDFDYTMTDCGLDVTNNKENTKKLILGNNTPNEIREALKASISNETLISEAQKLIENNDPVAKALEYTNDAKKLNRSCAYLEEGSAEQSNADSARSELEKKVAAIYVIMREEHRSHNFLWRWFKGGESRARLNTIKDEYCKAFGIKNKNHATERMLELSQENSMLSVNHMGVMRSIRNNNFFKELEEAKTNKINFTDYERKLTNERELNSNEIDLGADLEIDENASNELSSKGKFEFEENINKLTDIFGNEEKINFSSDEVDNEIETEEITNELKTF